MTYQYNNIDVLVSELSNKGINLTVSELDRLLYYFNINNDIYRNLSKLGGGNTTDIKMIVYFWFTLKETFKDYQQLMKIFNVSQTKYYNINTWINKNGYLYYNDIRTIKNIKGYRTINKVLILMKLFFNHVVKGDING